MVKLATTALMLAIASTTLAAAQNAAGLTNAADYSADHGGRAMLVQQGGKIIFERYDNGWGPDRPHPLASGTKSFTGVLAMLAVQDGLIALDEKSADTLVEWKADPEKSKITVRHLLTLSSGLTPGDREFGGPSGSNMLGFAASARAKRLGLDSAAPRPANNFLAALHLPMNHAPGSRFEYGPSHFYAFGELLQRKLAKADGPDKTTMDYLQTKLLNPVGITVPRIGRDRSGNPNLPGGMLLTAREWARFGQFVIDGGKLRQPNGSLKPWLKPELLNECFVPSAANPAYGLTWWLPTGGLNSASAADSGGRLMDRMRRRAPASPLQGPDGKPLKIYMAAGLGKQRLYVIPAYDLVVVRFAEGTQKGMLFNDQRFLRPILDSQAR